MTIVMVDDDIIFLNKLNSLFAQDDSCTVLASATSGEKAMALVKEHAPDLLIADIEMPKPNGLELLREIKRLKLRTEVLILSNYSSFDYVRTAMLEGALDYILKDQLNAFSFRKKMREITERVSKNKANRTNRTVFSQYMKQRLLLSCAEGCIPEEPETSLLIEEQEFCRGFHTVARLQLVDAPTLQARGEPFLRQILNTIQNIFQIVGNGICTYAHGGSFLLLLQGTGHAERAAMIAEAQKVLLLIKSNLMKIYGLESFCTSELFCDEVRSLSRYDRLCLKRMDDTLLPGMGEHSGETYRFPFGEELKLVAALYRSDLDDVSLLLEKIFRGAASCGVRGVMESAMELYKFSIHCLEEIHAGQGDLRPAMEFPRLNGRPLTDAMQQYFLSLFRWLAGLRHEEKTGVYSVHIAEAIDYVRKNYARDLSIEVLADHLHLSSVYFSHLFKSETGVAFSSYLAQHRIAVAKDLLKNTGYSLMEITRKVGFQNYNYFIQVFKKTVGVTPLRYRLTQTGHKGPLEEPES